MGACHGPCKPSQHCVDGRRASTILIESYFALLEERGDAREAMTVGYQPTSIAGLDCALYAAHTLILRFRMMVHDNSPFNGN